MILKNLIMKEILLISLMFFFIQSFAQEISKKELKGIKEKEEYNSTVALINGRRFEFIANQALPQQGSSIDLTTNQNYLMIKDDSVFCFMPFFGRAFNIGYNEPGGFQVTGIIENFEKEENTKKMKIILEFKLKGSADSYQFHLNISGNKSASLTILSNNRATISYWGEIRELDNLSK